MKLVIIGGYGQVGQEFQKHVPSRDLILLGHAQIEVADEGCTDRIGQISKNPQK